MTAWESPRAAAIDAIRTDNELFGDDARTGRARAEVAVNAVFHRLIEPDRDMLEAGAAELIHALPPGSGKPYARNLAGVVWRAMLEAAR